MSPSVRVWRTLLIVIALLVSGLAPAADADRILIPAGSFIMGSDRAQRELGYRLDEARGSGVARRWGWFENETLRTLSLPAYRIDRTAVTQAQYRQFVSATGHPVPAVEADTWAGYGLIHPFATAQRYSWNHAAPPQGLEHHPVVLVSATDAAAYCRWRGTLEGRALQLPSEAQWEKAARGDDGRVFPWGDQFDPARLNSADAGPHGTEPVASRPAGQSPYGVQDMAGQVFEWTATPCDGEPGSWVVKGGAWDDYPGVTRAAARHCRPAVLKHVLIGFRCVESPLDMP